MKTFPLKIDELQQVLAEGVSKLIHVDYQNSQIKKDFFLNYVANLNLNVDIDLSNISCEEKQELLALYLNNSYSINIRSLNELFGEVLLYLKGYVRTNIGEFAEAFREKNKDLVENIIRFLDSILYTINFNIEEYKNVIGRRLIERGAVELIDDSSLGLGVNVIRVLNLESFTPLYYSLPIKTKPAYYKYQMEGNFYEGNSLFNYLVKTDNILIVFSRGLAEQWFGSKDFLKSLGDKDVSSN